MKVTRLTLKSKKPFGKLLYTLSACLLPFLLVMSALSVVFDSFRNLFRRFQSRKLSRQILLMQNFRNYNQSLIDDLRKYNRYDLINSFKKLNNF